MDSGSFCREKFSIFLYQADENEKEFPSVQNNGEKWKKVGCQKFDIFFHS